MASDALRSATRSLQEYLRSRGYASVRVDGAYGPKTAAAAAADSSDLSRLLTAHVQSFAPRVTPRAAVVRKADVVAKVKAECLRQGVSYEPVAAIVDHESRWNHAARSSTGAVGLFQLTKWPIQQYNQDVNPRVPYELDDRFDLDLNIRIGVWYIRYCARFMGVSPAGGSADDWARIYGAYNLGPGAMKLLTQGQYDHKAVVSAWTKQSSLLRAGGIRRYESNARSLFV